MGRKRLRLPAPQLEKRLLNLLDVTLCLLGILLLYAAMEQTPSASGTAGDVVRLAADRTGEIVFGARVLATTAGGVNEQEIDALLKTLGGMDRPLVLLYYPRPSNRPSKLSVDVMQAVRGRIEATGAPVRLIPRDEEPRGVKEPP
ncbi:MAG: hypothetical protein ACRDD1_04520 [Planctomycetia bacterium]